MVKSELSVTIDAPREKVFARLCNPMTRVEDSPSIIEVKDVKGEEFGIGSSFRFVYKMLGMPFDVEIKITDFVPNERIAGEFKGGITGNDVVTLEPHNGGTKLTYVVEYGIPIPLVGKVAELFLKKQNEREGEVMFANLKARVEAGI